MARETIDSGAPGNIRQCRRNHPRDTVGPPRVYRNKGDHQQMGQRKPDRAELRQAGPMRIEDAPRNVEVRDGIAVIEHRAVAPAPEARKRRCSTVDAATSSHSLRLMGRRIGSSVKVGQLAEQIEAVIDFLARQLLQAFGSKALNGE